MDSQSVNASEVPDEITCKIYQDEQFVEEIISVNDLYFANKNQFVPLLTSPDDDSDRDEISDGHDDCTDTSCDIHLEHRSVDVSTPRPGSGTPLQNAEKISVYAQKEQVNFTHCNESNDHNYVHSNLYLIHVTYI